MVRLDLACGKNKKADFTGIDRVQLPGVDIVFDLEKFPWTFAEDGSVDEIYCCHYIEHTEDVIKFMDECYRILKTGGSMTIIAPYWTSVRAWQDPTHKRAISEMSFLYYNKAWREINDLGHYGIKSDYDFTYGYNFYPEWATRNDEARAYALSHYFNVASDIQVVLTKREAI